VVSTSPCTGSEILARGVRTKIFQYLFNLVFGSAYLIVTSPSFFHFKTPERFYDIPHRLSLLINFFICRHIFETFAKRPLSPNFFAWPCDDSAPLLRSGLDDSIIAKESFMNKRILQFSLLVAMVFILVNRATSQDQGPGSLEDEIKALKQVVDLRPDDANAHYDLGNAYSKAGRHEEAIVALKHAVLINSDFAQAYYGLGVEYGRVGRLDFAVDALKEAIRINPDFAKAHYKLGFIYGRVGIIDGAIQSFKEVVRINPDFAGGYFNLGVAYGNAGRHEDAIEAFKGAIRVNPDDAEAHCGLGYEYESVGNRAAALEQQKILETLDKDLADKLFKLLYK
jgi:tetratricopeptide (TPR) repeat protein